MDSDLSALSPFQIEKLEYYFNFFGPNKEGNLDKTSLGNFIKCVLEFTGWDPADPKALYCKEIHEAFFEILLDMSKAQGKNTSVFSLNQWLNMWNQILPGCMGIQNFPIWLRLLPKTLFEMMDRNGDGFVGEDELLNFYKEMVRIPEDKVAKLAHNAYNQMTDEGRYPLNLDCYEMIFANFLIGKTPYGPGRHIFGCFEHDVVEFKLIQPARDSDEEQGEVQPGQAEKPQMAYKARPFRQSSRQALFS